MAIKNKQIYQVVERIPRGCVATYGQIARLAGIPNGARQVGYALASLKDPTKIPWHRVVNAKGEISLRSNPDYADLQKQLLIAENVFFTANRRIDMVLFQWDGCNI